jgi:uncharacterized RDD family membrane protein YckC
VPRAAAPYWRRIAAWLIDEVARVLFFGVLLIVLVMLGGQLPDAVEPGEEASFNAIAPQVVLRIGLSWICWSLGTSPGAMVMRLRLVDAQGKAPGPVRGGVRAVLEVVSVATLMVGFAWAIVTRRRQTWHDFGSGTFVIDASAEDREHSPREGWRD